MWRGVERGAGATRSDALPGGVERAGRTGRDAAGGDFDLFGDYWRLWGKKNEGDDGVPLFCGRIPRVALRRPGALATRGADRIAVGNGGQRPFSNQVFTMKELYWEQLVRKGPHHLPRRQTRSGKLLQQQLHGRATASIFLNAAFSSFPVRSFPGQGLGINATTV